MRLLIVLIVVFTLIIGGIINVFILDRIDAGFLRNQTWHYGASPHNRRINIELTSNENTLNAIRNQMRAWTPQIMGVAPNATGQDVWQKVGLDGLYFGASNLADAHPGNAFQTDVVWEHQGLRPSTGDLFNHHMTAFPTRDNQDLMMFNVGYQGNRFGQTVRIVTDPDFLPYLLQLENFQAIDYDVGGGLLGPHPEVARLTALLQEHSELVTVHTMHFHPANFALWASPDVVREGAAKHDQAVLSLMSFLANMENSMVAAIGRVDDVQGAEREFNDAARSVQSLFNNTPGTDHAGFRAAAAFAQQLSSQTITWTQQNFNSPLTATRTGTTPMNLEQEVQWIWEQINTLGLDQQTAQRVMFIIMASTAVEADASYTNQINSRMTIRSSNRRTFTHWVGDFGGAIGEPPIREGYTTVRYDNWAEAVNTRLNSTFSDTYSPISRFATFRIFNSNPNVNASHINQQLYWAVRDQRQGDVHSFLLPVDLFEIHLDTVFVLYHLVMGDQGRFTVNGNRMAYLPRNFGTQVRDRGEEGRFFTYAVQSLLDTTTNIGFIHTVSNERDRRFVVFGENSPRDDDVALSGTLWFNREVANRGNNQRLSNTILLGQSVADMFEDSIFGMYPTVRREIRNVITNNDFYQHFTLDTEGNPLKAWVHSQERVASLHFSRIRLGFVPGHIQGNVPFTFPVFASGRQMALSFAASAEHIYNTEGVSFFTAGVNAHLVFWGHDLAEQRNIFVGQTGTHITSSNHVDRFARFRGREPIHISGYWLPAHQQGSNRFCRLTWAEVVASQGSHSNHLPLWQAMFGMRPPLNPPLGWTPEWWNYLDEAERQRQRELGFNYDLVALIGYTPMLEEIPNLGQATAE